MKVITSLLFLIVCCWTYHRAHAQAQLPPLSDYAFLRRIHVRDAVVNCIAAFDQWVRTEPRYDSMIVSEGNALRARLRPGRVTKNAQQASPIDATVQMLAFAKLRQKYIWVPVTASCGIWHKHVVSFSLKPKKSVSVNAN